MLLLVRAAAGEVANKDIGTVQALCDLWVGNLFALVTLLGRKEDEAGVADLEDMEMQKDAKKKAAAEARKSRQALTERVAAGMAAAPDGGDGTYAGDAVHDCMHAHLDYYFV